MTMMTVGSLVHNLPLINTQNIWPEWDGR